MAGGHQQRQCGASVDGPAAGSGAAAPTGAFVSEQDKLAALLRDGNLLAVLATFFGIGVLLSFTPCVLPMIPILSGIIVGQGEKVTAGRGFSLAFTYVQGMALTYAAAGAAFVLVFKQAPQAFFQKPWIIVPLRAAVRRARVRDVRRIHAAASERAADAPHQRQQPAEVRHVTSARSSWARCPRS